MLSEPNIVYSIAIATFQRPDYLRQLLSDLCSQEGVFNPSQYELLICDNDFRHSAKEVVEAISSHPFKRVKYLCIEEQNICLVRNKLLQESSGDAIVYLDDDQRLRKNFCETLEHFWKAWGKKIVGAKFKVTPLFDSVHPTWLRHYGFFDRPLPNTGEVIQAFSTNGCIFDRMFLETLPLKFDPEFGRTGGGDSELFRRLKREGCLFVSAASIEVFERVPSNRESTSYLFRRQFHHGLTHGRLIRKGYLGRPQWVEFGYICMKIGIFLLILPFSVVGGRALFVKFLLRLSFLMGSLAGYLGFRSHFY